MVNVIENRAQVQLRPLSPPEPGPSAGWLVCQVEVATAADVEGYPNLLGTDLPRQLQALVRESVVTDLGAVDLWPVEASLVGPGRLRVERLLP